MFCDSDIDIQTTNLCRRSIGYSTSPLGHKQNVCSILARCPLSSTADIQLTRKSLNRPSAYGQKRPFGQGEISNVDRKLSPRIGCGLVVTIANGTSGLVIVDFSPHRQNPRNRSRRSLAQSHPNNAYNRVIRQCYYGGRKQLK